MDHETLVAILRVIGAAIRSLPPLLAELRRWRRPPGSK